MLLIDSNSDSTYVIAVAIYFHALNSDLNGIFKIVFRQNNCCVCSHKRSKRELTIVVVPDVGDYDIISCYGGTLSLSVKYRIGRSLNIIATPVVAS